MVPKLGPFVLMRHVETLPDAAGNSLSWNAIWVVVALLGCLWVTVVNGAPLYYFDSVGYLDSGLKALRLMGLLADPVAAGGADGPALSDDGVVNGSRSIVYSILVTGAALWIGALAVPLIHALLVIAAALFLMRILLRDTGAEDNLITHTALPLLAAGLSSLPFYVAYFMPDILAGLLILAMAVLVCSWHKMRWVDVVGVLGLGILAVLSHPSHLLIAGLMVPVTALAGLLVLGRKWWAPTLCVALMAGAGAGERMMFSAMAEAQLDAEVTYYPFLTARLIQDRVGYTYLEEICPDPGVATCALYETLQRSDDPMRLTASHIMFKFRGELASLRMLPPDTQHAIAREQVRFAIDVGLAHPVATGLAIVKNTFTQARMASIRMTVPELGVVDLMGDVPRFDIDSFPTGRLIGDRGWIRTLDQIHKGYYIFCLAALAALFVWPGRLTGNQRILVLMVLAGILVNAFVCGAVSQPAHRYGSRVIWLLPFITMAVFLISRPPRPDPA